MINKLTKEVLVIKYQFIDCQIMTLNFCFTVCHTVYIRVLLVSNAFFNCTALIVLSPTFWYSVTLLNPLLPLILWKNPGFNFTVVEFNAHSEYVNYGRRINDGLEGTVTY